MRPLKRERTEEIIHRLGAKFVREVSSLGSLITVTRVELSPTGKEVKIFFTTLPDKEEDTVLKFLVRKIPEFKKFIMDESRISLVPHINFMIDYGERNRQRLDELSYE